MVIESRDAQDRRHVATVNVGLKRLDYLLMDTHLAVKIRYTDRGDGFYADPVGEDLQAMEDKLLEALGPHAVYIGHESGCGERVIHWHVATASPAGGIVEAWERGYPAWTIESVAANDPQWDVLRRW